MSEIHQHLVPIAGDWSLWRWLRLRSAGFPAARVLELGAEACAAPIEALLDREEVRDRKREAAIAAASQDLRNTPGAARGPLRKLLGQLRRGAAPEATVRPDPPWGPELATALAALARAEELAASAERELRAGLGREEERIARRLREEASDERFREAVTWQNRQAVHQALARLGREGGDNAHARRRRRNREQLVANYLQRYCVKNDAIGFFGPMGWGTLAPDGPALAVRPGPTLLAQRAVYFEHWAIDVLAAHLAENGALKPWLVPRRVPALGLAGSILHLAGRRRVRLAPHRRAVLAACDGEATAAEIARRLLAAGAGGLATEGEVFAVLDQLCARQWITWTLEIPVHLREPERALRHQLERVEAGALRASALGELDELERRRDRVASAAGDPAALDRALGELEASFVHLTGRPGTRRAGEAYAGRTIVYEDCRRDLTLELGREVIERLGPPLSLLLTSARWYTHAIASRYRALCRRLYAELRRETGSGIVEYLRFWDRLAPHFRAEEGGSAIARQVAAEHAERWEEILGLGSGRGPISHRTAELAPAVRRRFAAPAPGWPGARYHSPDVFLAAPSVEAAVRGEFFLVLGELHTAMNPLLTPVALAQLPHREELLAARDRDLETPGVRLVPKKEVLNRSAYTSLSPHDVELELGATRAWRPRNQVMAVGELVVEERNGGLVVRTRDARFCFDIITFLEDALMADSFPHFRLAHPRAHLPRVMIDALVVTRESWWFGPEEIPLTERARSRADRLLAAARWARRHRIPRFVFVKTPEEPKPFYLDFLSPILVEIFAKRVRQATSVAISEMLPHHGQCWLTDARGELYASELRLAAVDPCVFRACHGE